MSENTKFIIPFSEVDKLYMDVNEIVEKDDAASYIIAVQKVLTRLYTQDQMTDEELSVYFVENILPYGNITTVYTMLLEEAKRDMTIIDVRHIVEGEINALFNDDVAGATIDNLKEDFNSFDFNKLKSLLQIFVASN